ncbi:MAG: guanylate kinase [Spirochaetota bacterium]|jgi:guanylate kinase|nr:guanylate kinase [Spirochaetota bacterium]
MEIEQGRICIISGPSGAGKTTIYKRLLQEYAWLRYSVSATTRKQREHETDGMDYHFIDDDTFMRLVGENAFAEYAAVHGRRYGTLKSEIEKKAAPGFLCIFDIDVQGAALMLRSYPRALTIFIRPPDLAALESRLSARKTESAESLALRLANAKRELESEGIFEYSVINDDLESAYDTVRNILLRQKGVLDNGSAL